MAKIETIQWMAEVKEVLKAASITQRDIYDRNTCRQKELLKEDE